jgi:hypothetical protein
MSERGRAIPFVALLTKQGSHAALLDWPYKLHTNAGRGARRQDAGDQPVAPVLLYDISKDPKETTDLAAQQPGRVATMSAELAAWRTSALKSLAGDDYGPDAASTPAPPFEK